MATQKITGKASSVPVGLFYGAITSMGTTLLIAGILAKLIDGEAMAWENIGYGIMLLLLLASFLGANVASGKIKRQHLLICLMSGMTYMAILLSITALFFGGQYDGIWVTLLLVLGGSLSAALLRTHEKRGGKRYKKSMRPR